MARTKHKKVAEVNNLPNVYSRRSEGSIEELKKRISDEDDVTLELACGNGEYTTGLAGMYTNKFFLGVDRKSNRIWRGAKTVSEKNLTNAAFLISHIEKVELIFQEPKVTHIWIPFPEPYPMHGHRKKRVIHPRYLTIYKRIMKPGGVIHLKTDSEHLYNYAKKICGLMGLAILKTVPDLRNYPELTPEEKIMTRFESDHLRDGRKIYYISFLLDNFDSTKIPKYE